MADREACLCGSLYSTFKNIFPTIMHFMTNGYKRFSKTNSTDPRQRVPLTYYFFNFLFKLYSSETLYVKLVTLYSALFIAIVANFKNIFYH